jgi:hypothetical protein
MLFEAIANNQLEGFITASSATDIFYICRRQTQNLEEARRILTITLTILSVGSVDQAILETALKSGVVDFEDAVQIACAEAQQLDAIVTRNPQDFRAATIPVLSVNQVIKQLTR